MQPDNDQSLSDFLTASLRSRDCGPVPTQHQRHFDSANFGRAVPALSHPRGEALCTNSICGLPDTSREWHLAARCKDFITVASSLSALRFAAHLVAFATFRLTAPATFGLTALAALVSEVPLERFKEFKHRSGVGACLSCFCR